jgi:predicted amidophosphoribosyltransferase
MNLFQLDFGALLTYSSHGTTPKAIHSKGVMQALKRDKYVGNPPTILMSEWVARKMKQEMTKLPLASLFHPNSILVPVPKSSLMQPNTLWVPERIANALVSVGIGKQVVSCLIRAKAVPKAALSSPKERPTAEQHYESISVQGSLRNPDEIVLIDDVVTRGATLIGCANRLTDAFPQCHIQAFVAMRTISNPNEFDNVYSPCMGTIDLCETGDTFRRP